MASLNDRLELAEGATLPALDRRVHLEEVRRWLRVVLMHVHADHLCSPPVHGQLSLICRILD